MVKKYLKKEGLKLVDSKVRHNLGSWLTPKRSLKNVEPIITKTTKVQYANIGKRGYIDTQMLWQAFGRVPCFTFGAGEGRLAHKPNEYVRIIKLKKCQKIISNLIGQFIEG